MTNTHPRGSSSASSAGGGYSRAEQRFLRVIFKALVTLVVVSTLVETEDRVSGTDDYFYVLITFLPALGVVLFGLLLRNAGRSASQHTANTKQYAADRRPARPGTVPDGELTSEQQLVRKHFPGAVFETEERKRASVAASEKRMSRYSITPRLRTSSIMPVDWPTAELSAEQWMQLNGYPNARLTPGGADGGVDVVSTRAIAQVKHQQSPVGSGVVQQLNGVANSRGYQGRDALFFATYGFTNPARKAALDMDVKLYEHDGNTWRRIV